MLWRLLSDDIFRGIRYQVSDIRFCCALWSATCLERLSYSFSNNPSLFILSRTEVIISGKVMQTSPFTVAASASSFSLPHDFASCVVAPDIDPEDACDVVM